MLIKHGKQWEFLKNKFESEQLSHAYLFSGNERIGKNAFAGEFVEFVGCRFPDLMIVQSEDGKEIPIAKVREVQNFLSYKSYNGNFKIVIVEGAHLMNQEAQSCFLKTLEEPKGQTLLLLVSSKPEMLLDTIRSRCQQIKFFGKQVENKDQTEKDKESLKGILQVAGADLAVKFKYAKSLDFEEQKLVEILTPFEKYLRYLLLKKTGTDEKSYFSDIHSVLENYPVLKLKGIINLTEDINNKLFFTNVNQKLALEVLLLEI